MDDCGFPAPDSAMDVDYMDELLLGGCWLETTDGSDFLSQIPSTSTSYYDPSYLWPTLEGFNGGKSIASSSFRDFQEEGRQPHMHENSSVFDHQPGSLVNRSPPSKPTVTIAGSADQISNLFADTSELNRMFWIAPSVNPSPAYSVMARLMTALDYIKGSTSNKDVLIQIWVPIKRGGSNVLTTSEQPFSLLDPNCPKLIHYRKISEDYQFAADEASKETLGLPGRVFVTKVPEWTPDVRFFRVEEYPRVGHAQQYDVRGTLALPVFEQGSRNCLGVIEVIMTTQKVNYRPELESVCKALEAVDLRSSDYWNVQNVKEHSSSYQAALPEILDVLKSACETHGLPLAQTWVPCIQQGKDGCRHSDDNLIYCVSTVDSACFIADPQVQGFHEACSEHHLLKGQGVSGRAFLTNQPCFSEDIRTFNRTEYPLAHHARIFGICAAVAIRLRCVYTGTSDFVLEFFLPLGMTDANQQEKMLSSLSVMLQQVCRSLRIVTEMELEQESVVRPVDNMVLLSDDSPKREDKMETVSKVENASLSPQEDCSAATFQMASNMSSGFTEGKSRELVKGKLPEQEQYQVESSTKVNSEPSDGCTPVGVSKLGKSGEKRRTKAEKNITLDVLRQHFAGSLKDAAKSIGVCPTTLKRICRQHGIKRWPSRKIKKVGHSLQKLQVVIDSVQGASGAFQIGSFYPNFPDRGSPSLLGNSPFSTEKPSSDLPQASRQEPENGSFSPQTVASKSPSSSCSQSSTSSSQCYSSGNPQQTSIWNAEDPPAGTSSCDSALKRVRSEAEVCVSGQYIKKHISRSQSQRSFSEHHLDVGDNRPPLPQHGLGGLGAQEGNVWRVKVTYGEEKIRFRMLKGWGFRNVVHEVVKRFSIGDMGGFQLKYLDDDFEWVLLTCDADLEECIDICRSSQRQIIKLSLQVSHNHSRSSVGSNSQF